jgi:hypothetical protein
LLAGLLLNELQKEHQKVEAASAELAAERKDLDAMEVQVAEVQELKEKLAELEQTASELREQQAALTKILKGSRAKTLQRVSQSAQQ